MILYLQPNNMPG